MQLQPSSSAPLAVTQLQGSSGSFEAMTSFLNEQQDKFVSLLREERETAEHRSDCQRHEMETKLDEQRRETQQVREVASAMSCVSEAQLELL